MGREGRGWQPEQAAAGASSMAQQWAKERLASAEGGPECCHVWLGRQAARKHKARGLQEARAARPPAGAPIAAIAAATALQAVVVIGITAAPNTVQLTRAKLHALYVHLLL